MRTVYLDQDFKCHIAAEEGFLPYEVDGFDGKCDTYIEGFRIAPSGATWTRDDGVAFAGLMIAPWRNMEILDAAQTEYEKAQAALAEIEEALNDG